MDATSSQNGYYVVEQGQKKGPLQLSVLQSMRQQGTLSESTLVWTDGMADWQPARTVLPGIFAQPIVAAPGPTEPQAGERANLTIAHPKWRFLAGVIDVCILSVPSIFLTPVGGYILSLIYEAITMASDWQGTVGMKLLGLKVVDYSGHKISMGRSWGRALASIVSTIPLSLGYWLLFFTPRRQTLHDMLASTLVVKD